MEHPEYGQMVYVKGETKERMESTFLLGTEFYFRVMKIFRLDGRGSCTL